MLPAACAKRSSSASSRAATPNLSRTPSCTVHLPPLVPFAVLSSTSMGRRLGSTKYPPNNRVQNWLPPLRTTSLEDSLSRLSTSPLSCKPRAISARSALWSTFQACEIEYGFPAALLLGGSVSDERSPRLERSALRTITIPIATTATTSEFPVARLATNAAPAITRAQPKRRLADFMIHDLEEDIPHILKSLRKLRSLLAESFCAFADILSCRSNIEYIRSRILSCIF